MQANIAKSAEKLSFGVSSSTIIDYYDFAQKGLFAQAKSFLRTQLALTQAESTFIDFKRKEFPSIAKSQYETIVQSYRQKNKVILMKHLSLPLYNVVKHTFPNDSARIQLPFDLFNEVKSVKIVQARIFSFHKHNMNPFETWHQLTCEFIYADNKTKEDVIRFNVLERRECDSELNSWRFCSIGNINKEHFLK